MTEVVVEGVTGDCCSTHGMWLDKGELAAIVGAVQKEQESRGKRIVRRAALTEMARQTAARENAFLGGVWATAFTRLR